MAKDNLRLISARIDEESYKKISDLADRHPYWTKNYIIRQILLAVLRDFNDGDIYDMLRKPYHTSLPTKCEYRYPYSEYDSKH